MQKWSAVPIVLLLAALVFLVGRPQYLQWRGERDARRAEVSRLDAQAEALAAATRDCPVVAREWEAYKQLRQPATNLSKDWRDADRKVSDCISGGHLKPQEIAGYYGN